MGLHRFIYATLPRSHLLLARGLSRTGREREDEEERHQAHENAPKLSSRRQCLMA